MAASLPGASGARPACRLAVLLLAAVAAGAPAAGDEPSPVVADALPRSVDLGPGLEAAGLGPRRQGPRGTCSVFTMTGAIEAAIARAEGRAVRLSVEYLNWAANRATGRSTDGQFFHTAWAGYARLGVATENTMPYARRFDPRREPPDEARRSAQALSRHRLEIRWIKPLDGKRGVTAAHLAATKAVLARGVPVCAGSHHSVLFVGYEDDPARPGGGVFRCFDSGTGRRGVMSYREARGRLGDICWIDGPGPRGARTEDSEGARAGGSPPVTLASLLREAADLDHLTRLPVPWYRAAQASSYDRASKSPRDEKGWFANGDRGHFVRVERRKGRREHVLLDVKGPGVLTRVWSANPQGTLRIYLDGAETPAIEAPMARLLAGKVSPFLPPFAYVAARGFNLYFPIPYAARCKVTSDRGGFYYHVGYRTYPSGTRVEPYSLQLAQTRAPAIARARRALRAVAAAGASAPRSPGSRAPWRLAFALAPGAGRRDRATAPPGGGAIRRLRVKVDPPSEAVLRGSVITIAFDGEETVRAPLGDLFGTGPGPNAYTTLPFSVSADGRLTCRFPMPFRERVEIALENRSGVRARFSVQADIAARPWDARSLYFHAGWRQARVSTARPVDVRTLTANGQGIYVGNALAVANPVRAWWGEGDEKIYIDGERFPSHFGTGTEDYYGYAWGSSERFARPYHAQTRCDGPRSFGHTSLNRFHVLDPIPFSRSLRFDLEIWHWDRKVRLPYAVTSYWYGRPGATDDTPPLSAGALRVPGLPASPVKRVAGALEGERLDARASAGVASRQDMAGFGDGWSGDAQLFWRGARPGARLSVRFPSPAAGRYRVRLALTRAPDYGTHRISLPGGPPVEVDLWHPRVVPGPVVDLGPRTLSAGINTVVVEVTGTNPRAKPKAFLFGLDYLLLRRAGDF